jgi:hypothetical protein
VSGVVIHADTVAGGTANYVHGGATVARQRRKAVAKTLAWWRAADGPARTRITGVDCPIHVSPRRQIIVYIERSRRARRAIGERDGETDLVTRDHRIAIGSLANANGRHKIGALVSTHIWRSGIPHIAIEIISDAVQRVRKRPRDGCGSADSRTATLNVQINCCRVACWINKHWVGGNAVGILAGGGLPVGKGGLYH